jgi:hypothetical protein
VHVGSRDGDVAQRGRFETAHVGGVFADALDTGVRDGKAAAAVDVVEAGVVKQYLGEGLVGKDDVIGEREAAVAVVALELLAVEQGKAALGRVADDAVVARHEPAIEGGVAGDEAALEAGDGAIGVREVDGHLVSGEGDREALAVFRNGSEALLELALGSQAELDRAITEHG